ncbi:hypothetical protein SIN09_05720 [Streptomyces sp. F8]|uniref:hypothetical protein n=1 Tax=Streptomyces sp. F8 TaxID=1436085 RepID=UPI0029CC509C|nr:hypothetical protein [Streptomyces sp. F8]MDX6758948.1 hypothetical protein [Streptomyces sp. F8]
MSLANSPAVVALVTAISTLSASALTGLISLRVQRRQLDHQAAITSAEHELQMRTSRRDERKKVYSDFITQAVRVANASLAMTRPGATDPEVFSQAQTTAESHLTELWPMVALVHILSPHHVAELADAVPLALRREMAAARAHPGGSPSAIRSVSEARQQATRAFAAAVREVIEEP